MAFKTFFAVFSTGACIAAILIYINGQNRALPTRAGDRVDRSAVLPYGTAEVEVEEEARVLNPPLFTHEVRSGEEVSRETTPVEDRVPVAVAGEQPSERYRLLEELVLDRPQLDEIRSQNESLRQQFLAETVDSVWSSSAEPLILGKISSLRLGFAPVAIETQCRTTLCRVQVDFAGNARPRKPNSVSMDAMMYVNALVAAIPEEQLGTVSFTTGYNGYGLPVGLLYLKRNDSVTK